MTAPHKDRVDFIIHFRDQFPDRGREECIRAANQFLRLAATHQRLAVDACNGPPDAVAPREYPVIVDLWWKRNQRQMEANETRIFALCAEWGIGASLGGDPRGYTVKLHLPDGRGNTWGGDTDGWGVPA
jgi:hypothetical protein